MERYMRYVLKVPSVGLIKVEMSKFQAPSLKRKFEDLCQILQSVRAGRSIYNLLLGFPLRFFSQLEEAVSPCR